MKFYVYEILVEGEVKYVGKGIGRRVKNHLAAAKRINREFYQGSGDSISPFYKNLISAINDGRKISYRVVEFFECEQHALDKEIRHISSFQDGILWNDGPGGNGGTSNGAYRRWTKEFRRQAHSEKLSQVWADPVLRKRHSDLLRGRKKSDSHSEAVRASWDRPGERARRGNKIRAFKLFVEAKKRSNLYSSVLAFGT